MKSITPPQLAEQFGIGVTKVHDWIESGELVAVNVATNRGGRPRWIIEPEELERFKRSRSSTPAPKPLPRRKAKPVKEFFA